MDLKADLLRPEAYRAGRPEHVGLVETHISWVFLGDSEVFKVKKPVDFGFLDFRAMRDRKAACDAEVSLNARLSPEVYRGVVAIRRGEDGRCCIGGDGPIVDWAVRMARLDDDHRADRLLARDELSNDLLDAIAAVIVDFHDSVRGEGEVGPFGTPDSIAFNVEENFAQTRDLIGAYLTAEEAEEIVRWQTSFIRGHEDLFSERIAAGRIRDGHGDLRLDHVYIDPPRPPTIIDCIEFNKRFRVGDVCADLAFLSMDLASHGRVDLAERLIARYAQKANDFELYALVDFYESYRAYVRGKIAAMTAADPGIDMAVRERASRDARRLFLLALSAERRPVLNPSLVAVGGVIASGKSTIAEQVGVDMSAPVIDADRTRKALLGVPATQPVHDPEWQGAYDPAFTTRVYAEMLRRAGVVLASGRPVVVEGSFRTRSLRRSLMDLAAHHHVPCHFVECRANASVCRSRLAVRVPEHGGVSDGRLEIFDAFCAGFEPVSELAPDDHVILDTTRPLDESVAVLRAHLEAWPRGAVT